MSAVSCSSVVPTTSGASALIAATHSSLPRPIVNVMPWPTSPSTFVCITAYAAE